VITPRWQKFLAFDSQREAAASAQRRTKAADCFIDDADQAFPKNF
jgi:hypothetical protein